MTLNKKIDLCHSFTHNLKLKRRTKKKLKKLPEDKEDQKDRGDKDKKKKDERKNDKHEEFKKEENDGKAMYKEESEVTKGRC